MVKPSASTAERQVGRLVFLGEQDGPVEYQLKDRLVQAVLVGSPIARAYLARVESDAESGVALCLRGVAGGADRHIVRKVAEVFGEIFGAREHLDIVFVSEAQERELRRVCTPFWDSDSHRRGVVQRS